MNKPYSVYAGPYRAPAFATLEAAKKHADSRAKDGHAVVVYFKENSWSYPKAVYSVNQEMVAEK